MQRQADFFPEPNHFNPDRFGPDHPQPHKYAFIPFGAGSRTCIGNAFAMLEMQAIFATLLRKVDLSLVPGQTIEPGIMFTLRPKNGVKVVAQKRVPMVVQ